MFVQANAKPIPLTIERIQQFGKDILSQVQQQLSAKDTIKPTVYFLPGEHPHHVSCFQICSTGHMNSHHADTTFKMSGQSDPCCMYSVIIDSGLQIAYLLVNY